MRYNFTLAIRCPMRLKLDQLDHMVRSFKCGSFECLMDRINFFSDINEVRMFGRVPAVANRTEKYTYLQIATQYFDV